MEFTNMKWVGFFPWLGINTGVHCSRTSNSNTEEPYELLYGDGVSLWVLVIHPVKELLKQSFSHFLGQIFRVFIYQG